MPRISTLAESYPTDCEVLLHLRSQYADRNYYLSHGYITYNLDRDNKPFEHRLVAELFFGEIPPRYHVHHINHIRTDNSASNLQVISDTDHQSIHRPSTMVMAVCPVCQAAFMVTQKRIRRAKLNKNYCSLPCKRLADRRVERPSKEELIRFLGETPNFLLAGQYYGATDNAVRKWCDQYGLPRKTAD